LFVSLRFYGNDYYFIHFKQLFIKLSRGLCATKLAFVFLKFLELELFELTREREESAESIA